MKKTTALTILLTVASFNAFAAAAGQNDSASKRDIPQSVQETMVQENLRFSKLGAMGTTGTLVVASANSDAVKAYNRLEEGLSNLNTNRGGGPEKLKGFVAEHLDAANLSAEGKKTIVLDKNGAADLEYTGKNGHKSYKQLKFGDSHTPANIDFEKYRGQELRLDIGNKHFNAIKQAAKKYGIKVVRSDVSSLEAESIARALRAETALT